MMGEIHENIGVFHKFNDAFTFDLVAGEPLAARVEPERLFRGASSAAVFELANRLPSEGRVSVKLGPAPLVTITPAQFELALPAGGVARQTVNLEVGAGAHIGEIRIPYEVTAEDARYASKGTVAFSVGDPVPRLGLSRVQTPPVIDGTLDDAAWQGAPLIPELRKVQGGGEASQKTAVWAAYDDAGIYVAFRCLEAKMDKVVAQHKDRGAPLYQDDDVELFIDPPGMEGPFQFAVNSLGAQSDNFGNKADWRAAATRGEAQWCVEMHIPFSALGSARERLGLPWDMQFGRQEKPFGETTSWTPGPAFIHRESMGQILFQ